ncbi:unnamed protein product [Brachionus calyciflorus]|uniref:Uncharacterized protein n=1 Tax=Brachionus calyciflorus TaxID=104777 RepID=A0A813TMN9_9BILA|nr:unnamed protein product [Brachionus calyciflorus]
MVNLNTKPNSTSNNKNNNNNNQELLRVDCKRSELSKKNSFTDRANKLIKQFELYNSKLDTQQVTKDSQEAKIINSLLLPSQYIDLSLFFYSPNQLEKDKDLLLQTSTDSSVLTSSTISNTSSSSVVSNQSFNLEHPLAIMTSQLSNNTNLNFSTNNSSSDEHEELVAEMEIIERLPTQERLRQAKRRRALQLKKWNEFDAQNIQNNTIKNSRTKLVQHNVINKKRNIKFQHHIVLLDAIMRKDYDEVERQLQSGITPNSANEDGLTAIHQCCIDDSADLLKLLIKYEICKILVENNADLLAVNTDGNMPYDICEDEVCLEYIESEMASRGVTQQTIDLKRSESEFRMLDDLKTLCLEQIYFYLKANNSQKLSLKHLTKNINNSFFEYFLEPITPDGKLDLNSKDSNGATLLHIAAANGYNTVIEFLLVDVPKAIENGAPIAHPSLLVRDNDGWTPLHVATFWGHQKAIEILLEAGADIDLRTKNDETVVDLCDDPDVKEFIVQKSKEIETEQAQRQAAAKAAAAAAVMQSKLQLISSSNNSLNNGSIKGTNSSSRSLKRTSTGVSRSSSVRRSSFREKEKAARKLDTSFKDFLYATEAQETQSVEQSSFGNDSQSNTNNSQTNAFFNQQYLTLNEENENLDNSYDRLANQQHKTTDTIINPIIINHKDQLDSQQQSRITNSTTPTNNKKITSVVKIINNNTSTSSLSKIPSNQPIPIINIYEATPSQNNKFIDDVNNNQLKLNNETNNSTLTTVSQIARIHSTGAYITNQSNQQQNLAISNYSMTQSIASTSTLPLNTSNNSNTVSTSSIAIVDISTSIKSNKKDDENQAVPNVRITQPNQFRDNNFDDGVKYKFISNQTIGGTNKVPSEFDDFNMDSTSAQNGNHKRLKCFKCCSVM